MTDTFTSSQRFTKQQVATNRLVWGTILNSGLIDLLDEALARAATIDVTAGNVTLTDNDGASSEARAMTLLVTGAPGAVRTIFVPTRQKVYTVHNACGQTVTVRTSVGTGIQVLNGTRATLFVDALTNEVYWPDLHRAQTVAPDTTTMDSVACTVLSATAGTTNPTLYVHREGDHVSVSCNLISVTVADTVFQINPNSGSFGFPGDVDSRLYSQYVLEAGAVVRATMVVSNGAIVFNINGNVSGWTNPSLRVIPGMTFSYRIDD